MKLRIIVSSFFILILVFSVFTNNVFGEKFDKKKCIADIPQNAGVAVKNKMRRDCEDKETGQDRDAHIEKEKYNPDSPYKAHDFNSALGTEFCAQSYKDYKKQGENAYREKLEKLIKNSIEKEIQLLEKATKKTLTKKEKMSLEQWLTTHPYFQDEIDLIDTCVQIFRSIGDPNLLTSRGKIEELMLDKARKGMIPSKMSGNVKTPDLEELEKRINKKIQKLEKENNKLKQQLKKQQISK